MGRSGRILIHTKGAAAASGQRFLVLRIIQFNSTKEQTINPCYVSISRWRRNRHVACPMLLVHYVAIAVLPMSCMHVVANASYRHSVFYGRVPSKW
eukprot:349719-Chlamydomonas_euryale.AAC.2